MNELLFFLHIGSIGLLTFALFRLGKEALIAFLSLQALLANLFVLKQTTLFQLSVTCSDAFAVGSILTLNLLREFFGKEAAQKGIKICMITLLISGFMSQIHLLYTPSPEDLSQPHFSFLLMQTPRLFLASLAAFLLSQYVDLFLFGCLKRGFPALSWRWRALSSLILSELVDTLLFSFLALYGTLPSLGPIIGISFAAKLLIISTLSSLTFLARGMYREV